MKALQIYFQQKKLNHEKLFMKKIISFTVEEYASIKKRRVSGNKPLICVSTHMRRI
jgi:hypothetical protein